MRIIYVLLLTFCLGACTKIFDEDRSKYPKSGTWKIDDKIFTKQKTTWQKSNDSLFMITFSDGAENFLSIVFYKKPGGAGKYRMVSKPKQDDEVSIGESQKNSGFSGSRDKLGGTLYITVEPNGKLTYKAKGFKLEHITWVNNYNYDCSFYLTED